MDAKAALCFVGRKGARKTVEERAGRFHDGGALALVPRHFYEASALTVARRLLGKTLVHRQEGMRRAVRISEVEAYIGEHDLACHASKGRTARTDVLFGPPGIAYVYLIYGMYHCFNVVTGKEGRAAAVLVRAGEPLEGIAPGARTDGPGRLCRAMGIDLSQNRSDLLGTRIFIEDAPGVSSSEVLRGPRIGVEYSGHWKDKPYRLWLKHSRHVSKVPSRGLT
jgi:DNA-3-methyladenine glycosylase